MENEMKFRGLTANKIKMIAIFAMLIDHIAWAFVDKQSVIGIGMHIIGRTTAPIMCYFIVEGYYHTRNFKKYATRLAIFALISQMPFELFIRGTILNFYPLNMIYTLFLCLILLRVYDKDEKGVSKNLKIIGLFILSIPSDWSLIALIMTIIFWENRGDFNRQVKKISKLILIMVLISLIGVMTQGAPIGEVIMWFGMFIPLVLLRRYNGQAGGNKYSKWIFYLFYPIHLLLLALLKIL